MEIDCPEFRALIFYLKPLLEKKLVHADQLRNIIEKKAGDYHKRFKDTLKNTPGQIALACDTWTSINRHAFLAITGAWISEDWEMVEVLIDFIELKGPHTGDNMASAFFKSLKDLNILDKVRIPLLPLVSLPEVSSHLAST